MININHNCRGSVVGKRLKNAPLLEAMIELKWKLTTPAHGNIPGAKIDPDYSLALGRLSEKLSSDYPFHEPLPTASMPIEMANYIVQHRFRRGKDQWPLVQLGPGILTLNETEQYDWPDFEKRVKHVVEVFFNSYPHPKKISISELTLRYIDGVLLNYQKDNALNFLKDKMKIDVKVPENLFNDTGVKNFPLGYDIRFIYPYSEKQSFASVRFVLGKKHNKDALIWETVVSTQNRKEIQNQDAILSWIERSHTLTHNWFEKICEGELMESFR